MVENTPFERLIERSPLPPYTLRLDHARNDFVDVIGDSPLSAEAAQFVMWALGEWDAPTMEAATLLLRLVREDASP